MSVPFFDEIIIVTCDTVQDAEEMEQLCIQGRPTVLETFHTCENKPLVTQFRDVLEHKDLCLKAEDYEAHAKLRDLEKKLMAEIIQNVAEGYSYFHKRCMDSKLLLFCVKKVDVSETKKPYQLPTLRVFWKPKK